MFWAGEFPVHYSRVGQDLGLQTKNLGMNDIYELPFLERLRSLMSAAPFFSIRPTLNSPDDSWGFYIYRAVIQRSCWRVQFLQLNSSSATRSSATRIAPLIRRVALIRDRFTKI